MDLDFPLTAINVITNEGLETIAQYGIIAHPNPTYKRISLGGIKTAKGGEQYLNRFFKPQEIKIFKELAHTFISVIQKNIALAY